MLPVRSDRFLVGKKDIRSSYRQTSRAMTGSVGAEFTEDGEVINIRAVIISRQGKNRAHVSLEREDWHVIHRDWPRLHSTFD